MAKASSRDYTRERLNESPQRVKDRAMRNKARREMMREGRVEKGDGKVVDHKRPLSRGGGVDRSNYRVHSDKASDRQGGNLQPKSAKAKGGRK